MAIGLSVSIKTLLDTIKKHFNRQVMMEEEWRVKMIFLVFTVAYITRAIVVLFEFSYLTLVEDVERVKKIAKDFLLVITVMLNVYDVFPLALMMQYHRSCYHEQERTLNEADQESRPLVRLTTDTVVSESDYRP